MRTINKVIICVTFCFMIVSSGLFAQRDKIRFEHISLEQGLSEIDVEQIIQDSKGFIWIGTKGGLNRYDGYNFKVFRNIPTDSTSLSNNHVNSIYEDRSGVLWIGTDVGLNRFDYDTERFKRYQHNQNDSTTLSDNTIRSICEDSSGILWIGTANGLNRLDNTRETFIAYQHDPNDISSLSNNNVWAVYEDHSQALWIGTYGGGLNRFDKEENSFTRFQHDPNNTATISSDVVYSIREDHSGILWIGTAGGLNVFNKKTKKFTVYRNNSQNNNSLSNDVVRSIYEDRLGVLWIGTRGGLNKFEKETGKFISYLYDKSDPTSLCEGVVRSIFEDNSGVLWVGSDGLSKFDKKKNYFIKYQHDPRNPVSLNGNNVAYIYEDHSGLVWIGTAEGLNKFYPEKEQFIQYSLSEQNPVRTGNYVNSIYEYDEGTMWIGGVGWGLNKFDRQWNKFTKYQYDPHDSSSFNDKNVLSISEDDSGFLWVGIGAGLCRYDKRKGIFTRYRFIPNYPSGTIIGAVLLIYKDKSGILWFGTAGRGLLKFDEKKGMWTRYNNNPSDLKSLSGDFVYSIYEDPHGVLWVGTEAGLNKFDMKREEFIHYREADGLPDDAVLGILQDDKGNLWISTAKGLSKFQPENGKFRNYNVSDGLPSNEFNIRACCKVKDGKMYFGTINGLVVFHPDSIKDNMHTPPVVITNLLLLNRSVPIGIDTSNKRTILEQSIIETKEIELTYEDNIFSFEFAALDFHSPEKNKYAYMMEGFDKGWTYTDSKRRFATYTNLDPGVYTFRVKGTNNDGIWNEEGASIRIIITPPWWKTWWAYSFYVLAGLVLFFGFRRYELNRAGYKHNLELKRIEAEKLRETDRMKSHFFANISHEFRTPLTLILGPLERINRESSAEEFEKQTSLVKRNAMRLLNLINQLLDLSKLEAGKLKLHAQRANITSFIRGITMSFESIAEGKDIELKVLAPNDDIEMYFDKDMMTKILNNLLSNSFKFTKEGGQIIVSIKEIQTNNVISKESSTEKSSRYGNEISPLDLPAGRQDRNDNMGSVEIKIKDTGIGIAEEELLKLFDRFYQVDSSQTREYEGSGIGLALTKELVEMHKGTITVGSESENDNSKKAGWTEFTITLPLGKDHLNDDEIIRDERKLEDDSVFWKKNKEQVNIIQTESSSLSEKTTTKNLQSEDTALESDEDRMIILVVEDNADVREYIKDSLGQDFEISEAANGEGGLLKAEQIIPDLIISDIMMPKMDGNELTRRLKNNEKTSHIPIILLTAKSEQESKLEGLETGADDYLTKPFDSRELRVRIKNLINIRRQLQEKYSRGNYTPVKRGVDKKLTSLEEQFMSRVTEVIGKHLSEEEFSVEQWGKEVGMDRVQLHRKLKALTGKSPSKYLRSVRLVRARKMIENEEGNISEIAYMVGFSSPQYFTRCFKDEFGYPPSDLVS